MVPLRKIVIGVDFSIYSPQVMASAGDIAARNSAQCIAVSVISRQHLDAIKSAVNDEKFSAQIVKQFIEDEKKRRQQGMKELFLEQIPAQVPTKTVIKIGMPFEEILRVVEHEDADLVVINSKGESTFQEYMMGTTCEKIFRHCPVNLLCLKLGG